MFLQCALITHLFLHLCGGGRDVADEVLRSPFDGVTHLFLHLCGGGRDAADEVLRSSFDGVTRLCLFLLYRCNVVL